MGGSPSAKPTPSRRRAREAGGKGEPCDIDLEIDLVGLQPTAVVTLIAGHMLHVALAEMPPEVSVVCQTSTGQVVGSLSAFLGLTQLIACIRQGIAYRAVVLVASPTRCAVIVRQATAF